MTSHRPALALAMLLALSACRPDPPPAPASPAPGVVDTPPPAAPAVDAVQEIKASMNRFLAARSFHAHMALQGAQPLTSDMDYVAPDRYRIALPSGTQTVIGDTLYMELHDKITSVPLPKETLAPWRDPLKLQQAQAGLSADRVGAETVDGRPATRYRVRHTQPEPMEFDYWIGADGLPLQLHHAGTDRDGKPYTLLLVYSQYNDPGIVIDVPR